MSTELTHLRALLQYLRPTGRVAISHENVGQLEQRATVLTYKTDGMVPFNWPVTGSADMSIAWNDVTQAWTCTGTLFGASVEGNDPKTLFHSVARSIKSKEQTMKGFLQQAMTYGERYKGDAEQFQYRLSLKMSGSWHMERVATGYAWRHVADPGLALFFSVDTENQVFGAPPALRFGFFESPRLHSWTATVENFAVVRGSIAEFSHTAREFCKGASACFGKVDYSDLEAQAV